MRPILRVAPYIRPLGLASVPRGRRFALRVGTGVVGLPLIVLLVWLGSHWFTALVALVAAIGALELCNMAGQAGRRPLNPVAVIWAVALVVAGHLIADGYSGAATLSTALGLGALVSLGFHLVRLRRDGGLWDWAVTAGVALYVGGLLAYGPLLRGLEQGREWVLLMLLATFATDTGAFTSGRLMGRRPLAPSVSPGKTWEGAIGGLLAALGASVGLAYAFDLGISWGEALALGAMVGIVGQMGDLLESRVKRAAGAKESGWLIPGHGGVLDRIDSIVLNLPVVYYFVIWVVQ